MKLLFLTPLLLLVGCQTVVGDVDSTNYKFVPYIQTIQKAETIGHTDPEQRKRDMYACGVDSRDNLDDKFWGLNQSEPGETLNQVVERKNRIERCMKRKGYVLFGFNECGPLKAPTGLCN